MEPVAEYLGLIGGLPVEVRLDETAKLVILTLEGEEVSAEVGFDSVEIIENFCLMLLEAASIVWKDNEHIKQYIFEKEKKGV